MEVRRTMTANAPDLDALAVELAALDAQDAANNARRAAIRSTLLAFVDTDLAAEEAKRASPWGTYNLGRVKVVRKKKVAWDQRLLRGLIETIAADGANPGEFVDITETYTVPENRWKEWAPDLQEAFRPARTESPAGVDVEIVDAS